MSKGERNIFSGMVDSIQGSAEQLDPLNQNKVEMTWILS